MQKIQFDICYCPHRDKLKNSSYLKQKKNLIYKSWIKIDNLRLEKGSSFIRSNFYQALNFGKRFLRDHQMKIKASGRLAIFKTISQYLKITPRDSYYNSCERSEPPLFSFEGKFKYLFIFQTLCRLISKSFKKSGIVFDNL